MNAAVAVMEKPMAKDRNTQLESDVTELKSSVKVLDTRLSEFMVATTKEFGAVRTEMEKGFGSLKASIESVKLWMLVTGVGCVILVTFISFLGRVLKIF